MKQNLDTKVKHIILLILKISFLTLHQINPIFGYIFKIKITPDIIPINGLMDLSWWLQKGMTIVWRSYVIGHKVINPTNECGVKNENKIHVPNSKKCHTCKQGPHEPEERWGSWWSRCDARGRAGSWTAPKQI